MKSFEWLNLFKRAFSHFLKSNSKYFVTLLEELTRNKIGGKFGIWNRNPCCVTHQKLEFYQQLIIDIYNIVVI